MIEKDSYIDPLVFKDYWLTMFTLFGKSPSYISDELDKYIEMSSDKESWPEGQQSYLQTLHIAFMNQLGIADEQRES